MGCSGSMAFTSNGTCRTRETSFQRAQCMACWRLMMAACGSLLGSKTRFMSCETAGSSANGDADGITSHPTTIVRDHEGTIWANTESGVIRFNGIQWERVGRNWNFPEDVPRITSDV